MRQSQVAMRTAPGRRLAAVLLLLLVLCVVDCRDSKHTPKSARAAKHTSRNARVTKHPNFITKLTKWYQSPPELPVWTCRAAYVTTIVNPTISVFANDYTGVKPFLRSRDQRRTATSAPLTAAAVRSICMRSAPPTRFRSESPSCLLVRAL